VKGLAKALDAIVGDARKLEQDNEMLRENAARQQRRGDSYADYLAAIENAVCPLREGESKSIPWQDLAAHVRALAAQSETWRVEKEAFAAKCATYRADLGSLTRMALQIQSLLVEHGICNSLAKFEELPALVRKLASNESTSDRLLREGAAEIVKLRKRLVDAEARADNAERDKPAAMTGPVDAVARVIELEVELAAAEARADRLLLEGALRNGASFDATITLTVKDKP
jgi:hypothetical protein